MKSQHNRGKKNNVHSRKLQRSRRNRKRGILLSSIAAILYWIIINRPIFLYMKDNQINSESMFEFISSIMIPILLAGITAFLTLLIASFQKESLTRLRIVSKIGLIFVVILLANSVVISFYAKKNISYIKNETKTAEVEQTTNEAKSQIQKLEKFDWQNDLYIQDIKKYMGEIGTDNDIPLIINLYLDQDIIILSDENGDYLSYEQHVINAAKYHNDYENASTPEVKFYACELECKELEAANTFYTDVECLKMTGDCYVSLGDLGNNKLDCYEKALRCYINALHVLYQGVQSQISESNIWKELKNTYMKVGNLGGANSSRAQTMALVCNDRQK